MAKAVRDIPKHRPTTGKTITPSSIWEEAEAECTSGNMQTARAPSRMNGCATLAWVLNNATSVEEQAMPIGSLTDTTPALLAPRPPAHAPPAKEPATPLSPRLGSPEKLKHTCKHAEKWKHNTDKTEEVPQEARAEAHVHVAADAVSVELLTNTLLHPQAAGCSPITTEVAAAVRIAVLPAITTIIPAQNVTATVTYRQFRPLHTKSNVGASDVFLMLPHCFHPETSSRLSHEQQFAILG